MVAIHKQANQVYWAAENIHRSCQNCPFDMILVSEDK